MYVVIYAEKGEIYLYIIAHRGASGYAPENTNSAFKRAIEQNVDSIEIDVRMTKDNVPIVCHDATINRTSDGDGFIHELTTSEIKKYDFGSWYSPKFKGENISTLEEVLILIQNKPTNINIEIKNGPVIPKNMEEKIVELVDKYKLNERVLYSSFDHVSLERLYKLDPKSKFAFIFHINLLHLFDYIDRCEMDLFSIQLNHFYITNEIVQQAHKRNIKVNAYTVNDKIYAKKYSDMGVDGLITNYPLNMYELFK